MTQTVVLVPSSHLDPLPELGARGRPSIVLRPCDFQNWGEVFDARPEAEEYILLPGDYHTWGKCVINTAGTTDRRRLIRFIDAERKPWERIGEEAVTQGVEFAPGTSHWIVHGLTLRGPRTSACTVRQGAEHITFDSMLIEDFRRYGVRLAGNHSTVQNSVIRRMSPDQDTVAIQIRVRGVPNIGNHVLDNEIYDCNDGIGVTWDAYGADKFTECRDLIVEGNDLYLTEDRQVTLPEPSFPTTSEHPRVYAAAENGIDIKAGPRTSAEPLRFVRNRIWGFRRSAPSSAHHSDGAAVTIHAGAQRILFEHNIIFDCPIAFHEVERDGHDPNQGAREVTVRANIVTFMHPYNAEDLGAILRTKLSFLLEENRFSHSQTLSALPKEGPGDTFNNNVLNGDTPLDMAAADWSAGMNNMAKPTSEMDDVLVERCRWTKPRTVRLRGAVLSSDVF
jgi:hypothetical protein